jgi:hypothetical protein
MSNNIAIKIEKVIIINKLIKQNDLKSIKNIISNISNIQLYNIRYFNESLTYSCENSHNEIVIYFIKLFENKSFNEHNFLTISSYNNNVELVTFLLKQENYIKSEISISESFCNAVSNSHKDIFYLLCNHKLLNLSLHSYKEIINSSINNDLYILKFIIESKRYKFDVKDKTIKIIDALTTGIINASLFNSLEALKYLLLEYKRIESQIDSFYIKDNKSINTAVMNTVIYNNFDCYKLLINSNIKLINPSYNKNEASKIAFVKNHTKFLLLLWKDNKVKESLEYDLPEVYKNIQIIKNIDNF